MALDPISLALLKHAAEQRGQRVKVMSATAMTLPALFAAADARCVGIIQTDAETPEGRFVRLLSLADVVVRGACLDVVGGRA